MAFPDAVRARDAICRAKAISVTSNVTEPDLHVVKKFATEGTIQHLMDANQAFPTAHAHTALAELFLQSGDTIAAVVAATAALALAPRYLPAMILMAQVEQHRGNEEGVIAWCVLSLCCHRAEQTDVLCLCLEACVRLSTTLTVEVIKSAHDIFATILKLARVHHDHLLAPLVFKKHSHDMLGTPFTIHPMCIVFL